MTWPPDNSYNRIPPQMGMQPVQPLKPAGSEQPAKPDAVPAATGTPAAPVNQEPKDKDQVDQDKTRTGGFDPEKSISFDKSGSAGKADAIAASPGSSETAGMRDAFALASSRINKQGLPPAVEKLRAELSPDISAEDVKEAMFQAYLWANTQQAQA